MIREIREMWRDSWLMTLLGGLLAAAVIYICGLGLFVAFDSWFLPDYDGKAEVVTRTHHSAWIQTIVHSDGKNTWVQTIYWPEEWRATLRMDNLQDSVSISERSYDTIKRGDAADIKYRKGRFSDSLYITSAQFP